MAKILTITVNPALDIYSRVEKVEPDKKMRCEAPKMDPGGGGVNVSRVITRLEGSTKAIYTRGGHTGNIYSDLLDKENVNQEPVEIKNDMRQNLAVNETEGGDLYRFGFPGAKLEQSEYEELLNKISSEKNADFIVASGSLPPGAPEDFYAQIAKRTKKNDQKFVLDTSGKALAAILDEGAYLIKPNEEELQDLAGEKAENREEQKRLLKKLLDKYPIEVIVLSLGEEGAILATHDKTKHIPALKVEAESSIGAGDSMVAGIVCSLSQGNDIQKAVIYGLACGTATIKSPGTDLLKKGDAEKLYKEMLSKEAED